MKAKSFLAWTLCAMQLLCAAFPTLSAAAGPASSPTPAQLTVLQEAVRKGEFTPEARQVVRENPELRQFLPPKWSEELDAEMAAPPTSEGVAGEAAKGNGGTLRCT